MDDDSELDAWLCLLRAPTLGPSALRGLLAEFGSAGAARDAIASGRGHVDSAARRDVRAPNRRRIQADRDWLAQPGHHLLRCDEADFPPQLEHIDQPPAALFVDGDAGLLLRPQVAVVGARGASAQGLADACELARCLAVSGLVVTSGLADGIDGAAHRAALEAGGASIAVLGTGADRTYPRKHRELAAAMRAGGALVSEFPLGTAPRADQFPRRNRIIAGLAMATVVVEAGLRSGSLITARLAAEQGREVCVLPGSIHNPLKRGCHRLIRDGARLVEQADEVIALLGPAAQALQQDLFARLAVDGRVEAATTTAAESDPRLRTLLDALGHEPAALDELAVRSGLLPAELSSMLLELELQQVVASLPGGRYQRLA
ncbi:MAG TPA: DNA-processing protein DprA [Rhodanobacteraceae bacterium]|nr:DNA-processing protein DprA [Rhodanobacteraceae bacterium]